MAEKIHVPGKEAPVLKVRSSEYLFYQEVSSLPGEYRDLGSTVIPAHPRVSPPDLYLFQESDG